MGRRAIVPVLFLVLLAAPVANALCSTLCLAAAITSGCAHGLQPADDLPVAKTAAVVSAVRTAAPVADSPAGRVGLPVFQAIVKDTSLRL